MIRMFLNQLGILNTVMIPHRDEYVKVISDVIDPAFAPLYEIRASDSYQQLVGQKFDPYSIMAFSPHVSIELNQD